MTVDERGSISLINSVFDCQLQSKTLFLRIFDTQKVNRKVRILIRVCHLSRQISLATYPDSQQSLTLVTVDERGYKKLKNSIFDYQLKLKMLFLKLIDPQSKTLMTVDERRSISQKNSIFLLPVAIRNADSKAY